METTKTKYNYYSMLNGKISRTFKEKPSDVETVTRTNKSGNVVYDQHFDNLQEVMMTGVRMKTDDYGEWLEIKFNSDTYGASIFTIGITSGYYRSFMERLPNIDLNYPVTINAWELTTDKGSIKRGLWFSQNNHKVEKYYTKETPNGLPQSKVVVVNKKNVYDWTDQLNFYEEVLKGKFTEFSKNDYSTAGKEAFNSQKEEGYVNNHTEFAKSQEGKSTQKTPIDVPVIVDDEKLPWEQ